MGEVVVVPFGTGELEAALGATASLEAELSDARVTLIPLHDARDRFTARSRPPQTPSESDLDVLARAAHDAIEHVAFGRTAAAQKSVREVITRAERTLESLNRETSTARHILDACLSLVRSALQSGKRDLALEQATRCRRLVPDLMPSEDAHPANVVGVLAEADNLLRRMRIGHLAVSSAPETGCSVYVNGRHLGTTPFRLDRAAAGDYRVQVECNRTLARVHLVQLGDQPVSLLVDTQFDRTIASDPRLLLRYAKASDASEQAVVHAVQIGREIGATDVILVGVRDGKAEILRVQVDQQRLVARATAPWTERHGFPRAAIDQAITVLAEARLEGTPSLKQNTEELPVTTQQTASEPLPPEPPPAVVAAEPSADAPAPAVEEPEKPKSAPASPERSRRRRRIAGYSMLAAAVGITVLGIGYDLRAHQINNELSSIDVENAQSETPEGMGESQRLDDLNAKFANAQKLRWLGIAGPVLATATVFTVTEPRAFVPWWSYALAGAGVGLIVGGVLEIKRDGECDIYEDDPEMGCRVSKDTGARGALLIAAAAPFLSVPFAQWIRLTPERQVAVAPNVGPGRVTLMLHARF
ncbi:MAG TPA: PEGA domain-containing protein [Polyangiales bacterium]|nr:PEGA domain-containing protein [Polyangiales bacterium]